MKYASIIAAAAFMACSSGFAHAERSVQPQSLVLTNFAWGGYTFELDRKYSKQEVAFETGEAPGTIIVDTGERFLYFVTGNNKALRYGIGVGREGFTWQGSERVSRKAEWPDWRPTKEALERDPDVPKFVEGGPKNPLGARALYLGATEYRIHGTAQPWTIGHAVSSGCIRLTNDNVIDLYGRAKIGAKVIVR
jgi:lipoprotein-anchoring transpeptidase ErfK/SrfK